MSFKVNCPKGKEANMFYPDDEEMKRKEEERKRKEKEDEERRRRMGQMGDDESEY